MHPSSSHNLLPRPSRRRRGFTLVELMISIALALLLIYGVSQVFKLTGDTVGANTAVGNMVRDHRALSATVAEDFRNSLPNSPLFLISSRIAYGYAGAGTGLKAGWKNAEQDRDEGPDPLAPFFLNGSKVNPPGIASGTDRAPRLDRLGFFVRNLYRRQTAGNTQAASTVTSTDAYVWYGHTALPDDKNAAAVQPFEQYASDRILGRLAILMKDSTTAYKDAADVPLGTNTDPLFPIGYVSGAYKSMVDFAAGSVAEWQQEADVLYQTPGNGYYQWYKPMLDGFNGTDYWRAWCRPTVKRPIDQVKLAQTSSYFVGNCTQFIVEYAGDYLSQNEADPNVPGVVTDVAAKMNPRTGATEYGQTDGQIDYVIDTSADVDNTGKLNDPPKNPDKWIKRIRWYGLPRDVTGDGRITINDVVPLSDVMAYYSTVPTPTPPNKMLMSDGKRAVAPWEVELPNQSNWAEDNTTVKQGLIAAGLKNSAIPPRQATSEKDYWQQDYSRLGNGAATNFRYTAAFHNQAPAMIRITMKIDDPSGKLRDGQWYQYVLSR